MTSQPKCQCGCEKLNYRVDVIEERLGPWHDERVTKRPGPHVHYECTTCGETWSELRGA